MASRFLYYSVMFAPFNDTVKEEIRVRADIVSVVGRYVKLKQTGQTLKGLCPFHKEKTPSFHVNPARGYFHCFGCSKGGDVFTFLQEIKGNSFPEALKMLAEETGVSLAQTITVEQPEIEQSGPALSKSEMLDIHKLAAGYFYSMIKPNPQAVAYFKSRGLTGETARDFRLGFAPPGWSSLISFAESKGISAETLIKCGLAIKNENGGSVYDRFRDRVIFSLIDLSGRVIGFAGRGLEADAIPKYLNSPETNIYRKKEFLYGLNATRQYIKDEKSALVVEGYMDFLTLYQSGIRNAVATSGTAMTPEHAHLLKRFTSKIVLVFDSDSAGQAAAERAIFTLAPFDLDVSVLVIPEAKDPDEFIRKHGPEAFRELIGGARAANDFIIDRAMALHRGITPHEQKEVIDFLAPLAQAITQPIANSKFRKDVAERLGLDEKMVSRLLLPASAVSGAKTGSQGAIAPELLEYRFLHLLLSKPELIDEARRFVLPETLTDAAAGRLYALVVDFFDDHGNLNGVLDMCSDPDLRSSLSRMLVAPALEENIHVELVQKIIYLRRKFLKARIRAGRLSMKNEKSASRREELIKQIQEDSKQLQDLDERT